MKLFLPGICTGLLVLFFCNLSFAQQIRRCGTKEYIDQLKAQDPLLEQKIEDAENESQRWIQERNSSPANTQSVVYVPVVVHIVYKNIADSLPLSRVTSQIDVLNEDFSRQNADTVNTPSLWKPLGANVGIQFCLASLDPNGAVTSGVTYTKTTVSSFTTDDKVKATSTGGIPPWDRNKYMNIWVCKLSGGILGYTSPLGSSASIDGVVIMTSTFGRPGTETGYSLGRTCTHEAGHWFNLYHTWGDDGGACSGTDNVSDTPNQTDADFGAPAFPLLDACSTTSPGVMFMDYMDYTDDVVMNLFTSGQKTRMLAALNGNRASIKTSTACSPAAIADLKGNENYNPVSVYPNPASSNITVQMSNETISVVSLYTLLGEKILSRNCEGIQYAIDMDLSAFENGIYFVAVTGKNSVYTKKIILNR